MKKRWIVLPLFLFVILALVGVNVRNLRAGDYGNGSESYEIEDYILETDYHKDYRILQLTDIHLGNKDNRQLHYDFLDLTIRDADADLIVLSGDLFTFADKKTARELFDFVDSYGIPWTTIYGNHDEQCYFSVDWLSSYLNSGSITFFVGLTLPLYSSHSDASLDMNHRQCLGVFTPTAKNSRTVVRYEPSGSGSVALPENPVKAGPCGWLGFPSDSGA